MAFRFVFVQLSHLQLSCFFVLFTYPLYSVCTAQLVIIPRNPIVEHFRTMTEKTELFCYEKLSPLSTRLKGLSHEKKPGSKVVSIDSSFFKLLPQKISQIFIRPPSCFLHKTVQHHIIECCVLFLRKYPYGKNIFSVNGIQNWARLADGKGIFY